MMGMRQGVLAAMVMLSIGACADRQAQQPQAPRAQPQPVAEMQETQPTLAVASANYVGAGCRDFIAHRPVNAYAQGLCAGKVEAVGVFARGICLHPEVTVGQMIRVVTRYIDDRPARLHEDFMTLAEEAMRQAWPCRR